MKKNKKRIISERCYIEEKNGHKYTESIDVECGYVIDIIRHLTVANSKFSVKYTNIRLEHTYDCGCRYDCSCRGTYYIVGDREETDEEKADRDATEAAFLKTQTDEEREQYYRLKAKFENK